MKSALPFVATLCLLLVGCSSVVHYEVRLREPNPYSSKTLKSQTRPHSRTQSEIRFKDETGRQYQIEAKYVESIKPPPDTGNNAIGAPVANYQINLTETNIYHVRVAYTPEKPQRVSQKYLVIKRPDGRDLMIPSDYVIDYEAKRKKDLYEDPDPQFRKTFEYR